MELEKVEAVIRPRDPWEAVDLGFGMTRRWWRPIYAAWALFVVPQCLILFAICYTRPLLAIVLVWFFKPVFDRFPLFVLSRALFGATPSLRDLWRSLPKLLFGHLFSSLILLRFSSQRSLLLPVPELEGLRGSKRFKRGALLSSRIRSTAGLLTASCWVFEIGLVLAIGSLVWMILPSTLVAEIGPLLERFVESGEPSWLATVLFFIYLVAMSAIEPTYVAAGFALYLNRRIRLEGWDVELNFRRLVARASRESERKATGSKIAGAVLIALVCLSPQSMAEGAQVDQERDPEVVIAEILEHEDFDTTVTTRSLVSDGRQESLPWLPINLLKILVWILIGLILGTIIYFIVRSAAGWTRKQKDEEVGVPNTIFGLDIKPESLPDDVPGAAWELWQAGDARGAMGLLYRGAIARLVEHDGLDLHESDTESDCLRRMRSFSDHDKSSYFKNLTMTWQICAYAERVPLVANVRELCTSWNRHFEATPR